METVVKKRQSNYDWLRVLCAFMVIMIHVNAHFLKALSPDMERGFVVLVTLVNIITRFSVPCFLMLSGAFVLNRRSNKKVKDFYKRSFVKIGVPYLYVTLFWVVYLYVDMVVKGHDKAGFINTMVNVGYGGLWFMPVLIVLYLLVPLIIRIKEKLSRKSFRICAFALLIVAVLLQTRCETLLPISPIVIISYLSYFLMGNVLHNWKVKEEKRGLHVLVAGVLACVLVAVTLHYRLGGYDWYQYHAYRAFLSPTVALYSLCVFWIFHNLNIKRDIAGLASLTYYIYLVHTVILMIILKVRGTYLVFSNIGVTIVLVTVLVFVVSALLARLIDGLIRRVSA